MTTLENYTQTGPYEIADKIKSRLMLDGLNQLVRHHRRECSSYRRICDALGFIDENTTSIERLPFIPVGLFKELELKSVRSDQIRKTMQSSGTTGQRRSQIYIDVETANRQRRALAHIVSDVLGKHRLPMLIIDAPRTAKGIDGYTARTAGIQGFSVIARDRCFALNDQMEPDFERIEEFLVSNSDKKIFVFGFTSIIWLHFVQNLVTSKKRLDLTNGILIHGGGWKKIQGLAVSPLEFKRKINEVLGITSVHDYYGMVEQTGSISVECSEGYLHSSIYSEILIRDPQDLSVVADGERGLIQTMSVLPLSYPGHVLLTEDVGTKIGVDDCPCGRLGSYFAVHGRLKNSEIRGCSDTYQVR